MSDTLTPKQVNNMNTQISRSDISDMPISNHHNMCIQDKFLISARREFVQQAYNSAKAENKIRYLEGDHKATAEYIFPNQMEDACNIVNKFYDYDKRVVSIQKKTKVGADGLMIELATSLTTHPDDNFVLNPANVRIITGMSNAGWEKDMIDKAPNCFKDKIFHHGKLSRSDLKQIQNGLIIIDEIDSGDKEMSVLHKNLREAGILDVKYMKEHNIRIVFISATMIKELYHLYRWGEVHYLYKMTIPACYIGHKDFLNMGIIKEFYPLDTKQSAERWVQEDILDKYKTDDCRVHIVRLNSRGKNKNVDIVECACIRKGIIFRNHTSKDKLSEDEINEFFKEPLTQHIVLGVKGFFRRANLIPNDWKVRIGATHELFTKTVDNNVQIQGLPGRMTGYWRDLIERGHKTGPHRTSIKAILEYEKTYIDPFGINSYQTNGFKKNKGKVVSKPTMLTAKNIKNLEAVDLPVVEDEKVDINLYRIYDNEQTVRDVCRKLGYQYISTNDNADGFKETSLNNKTSVVSIQDAIKKVPTAYGTNRGVRTYRTYYPCYIDITDNTSLRFIVIIRPGTDITKVAECDAIYSRITL